MSASATKTKIVLLLAATVAVLVSIGVGIAYATGDGDDSSEQSIGPGMKKAKSVALDQVNGRVTATEFQDEEGYYEVEVTRDDGSQVDVHLGKDFHVLDAQSDTEGSENRDSSGNDGD